MQASKIVGFALVASTMGMGVASRELEDKYPADKVLFSVDLKELNTDNLVPYLQEVKSSNHNASNKEDHVEKEEREVEERVTKAKEPLLFAREGKRAKGRKQKKKQTRSRSCLPRANSTAGGLCLGRRGCVKKNGIAMGSCGQRGLVCCLMETSCNHVTSRNNTVFVNKGYPSVDSGTGACTLTINRYNKNICQMRFGFVNLELSQPDPDGNCVTDFLTVTGGISASPTICGSNSGQHMYVDVDSQGGAVRLTVDRTAGSQFSRTWKVIISQIECTSKFKGPLCYYKTIYPSAFFMQAPAGCLQYYTETSGTVSSFNFDQQIDEEFIPQTTRQILNMNYAVCIQMSGGYCSIMWTRNTTGGDYGFSISSNVAGLAPELVGDPASSSRSDHCLTDYVIVPGAIDDLGRQNDRFCGAGFPNYVTSTLRPFMIYVNTDGNEQGDVLNRGFSLDYRQMIC